jgi:hypothetical protein
MTHKKPTFAAKYGSLAALVKRSRAMVGVAGRSGDPTRIAFEQARHARLMNGVAQILAALP